MDDLLLAWGVPTASVPLGSGGAVTEYSLVIPAKCTVTVVTDATRTISRVSKVGECVESPFPAPK